MHENLEDKEMRRILEDVRESAPKPRGQKKNERKSRGQKENAPNSRGRKGKCIQP